MHKLKEYQTILLILIISIMLISAFSFRVNSCDVIAVDNQLRIMENIVDTNETQLNNGEKYTVKWYIIFDKVIYQKIILN